MIMMRDDMNDIMLLILVGDSSVFSEFFHLSDGNRGVAGFGFFFLMPVIKFILF